jgi:uncharacterized protein YecT (DUF1311 family)
MRLWITKAVAGAFALLSCATHAEHDSGKWNCDGSQLEMNFCAAEKFKHADVALNRLYQQKLAALQDPSAKARFRAAQRSWVAFRDKACLYEAGPYDNNGGGRTIWALQDFTCRERLTKQRTMDMEEYLQCTQNGCPN